MGVGDLIFFFDGTQKEEGKVQFIVTLSLVLATNMRQALLLNKPKAQRE